MQLMSLSSWERELKYKSQGQRIRLLRSLSSWERELKYLYRERNLKPYLSLSSWERELKYISAACRARKTCVALFVIAWIEIIKKNRFISSYPSLSSWERELKLVCWHGKYLTNSSLSSWERELKSWWKEQQGIWCQVALFVRAWIEIMLFLAGSQPQVVALFVRAWIEISTTMSWSDA